jgi:hypothetical protein
MHKVEFIEAGIGHQSNPFGSEEEEDDDDDDDDDDDILSS